MADSIERARDSLDVLSETVRSVVESLSSMMAILRAVADHGAEESGDSARQPFVRQGESPQPVEDRAASAPARLRATEEDRGPDEAADRGDEARRPFPEKADAGAPPSRLRGEDADEQDAENRPAYSTAAPSTAPENAHEEQASDAADPLSSTPAAQGADDVQSALPSQSLPGPSDDVQQFPSPYADAASSVMLPPFPAASVMDLQGLFQDVATHSDQQEQIRNAREQLAEQKGIREALANQGSAEAAWGE